jgi:hypothetical protein
MNSNLDESVIENDGLDNGSTSDSPKSSQNHNSRVMHNISKYIDFNSPILKYLIDIEKKYWASETNQNYVFPKGEISEDGESSIQSLRGITRYDISTNDYRRETRGTKISAKNDDRLFLLNSPGRGKGIQGLTTYDAQHHIKMFENSNTSNDKLSSKSKQIQNTDQKRKDKATKNPGQKAASRGIEERPSREPRVDRSGTPEKLTAHNGNSKSKIRQTLLLNKISTTPRSKSNGRSQSKKLVKEGQRRQNRIKETSTLSKPDTKSRILQSYLKIDRSRPHLELSEMETSKFGGKRQGKGLLSSKFDRMPRSKDKLGSKEESRGKIIGNTSSSKLMSKMIKLQKGQTSTKHNISSKDLQPKLVSGFLSSQRKGLLSNKIANPALSTPKESKSNFLANQKTNSQFMTYVVSQVAPAKSNTCIS